MGQNISYSHQKADINEDETVEYNISQNYLIANTECPIVNTAANIPDINIEKFDSISRRNKSMRNQIFW